MFDQRDALQQAEFFYCEGNSDVVESRHMRIKRVTLKHHRQLALMRAQVVHRCAVHADRTCRLAFQAGDDAHECRLAAARRSNEGKKFPVADRNINVVQYLEASERFTDVLDIDLGQKLSSSIRRPLQLSRGINLMHNVIDPHHLQFRQMYTLKAET